MFKSTKKKRNKRAPMRRKVYLMERTSNRTWKSIFSGRREIKIGIAKNSNERHQSVDNGIPGRVVVLASYSINRASTIEAELHKKYKSKNFVVKNAKRGAGATEFFRLSNYEIRQIKNFLSEKSSNKSNRLNLFLLVLIVLISLVIIYHKFK